MVRTRLMFVTLANPTSKRVTTRFQKDQGCVVHAQVRSNLHPRCHPYSGVAARRRVGHAGTRMEIAGAPGSPRPSADHGAESMRINLLFVLLSACSALGTVGAGASGDPLQISGSIPLVVCYPGNTQDLSSDGCPCTASNQCMSACTATRCGGVTNAAFCAPIGNGADLSADGCECNSNLDCKGNCGGASGHECGAGTPDPDPPVCSLGNAFDLSDPGCPCTLNSECTTVCSAFTRTCDAVVGAVAAQQPVLDGIASADVPLGGAVLDRATLISGLHPSGRMTFRLFGPEDVNCGSTAVFSDPVTLTGNGLYTSSIFIPGVAGTYRWRVNYLGDAYNLPVTTPCNDASQAVVITPHVFRSGFETP